MLPRHYTGGCSRPIRSCPCRSSAPVSNACYSCSSRQREALSITRLVAQPSVGGEPSRVEISQRIAPDDPQDRTLAAVPSHLPAGLYRVTWQALPAGGGVPRHGSFSFGVGVPVPADSAGSTHSLQDRDAGTRGRRHTWAGGALLLVLGALLPRLSPRA